MWKMFDKNPNIPMLQNKLGLSSKDARKADDIIRSYIASADCDEKALTSCIQAVLNQYPSSEASVEIDELSAISKTYLARSHDWNWGENFYCIVAYFYTLFSFIIDNLSTLGLYKIISDNSDTQNAWLCVTQFISTLLVVWLGNSFVAKYRGNRKFEVWFSLSNKYMPTFTMVAYILFYLMKLLFLSGCYENGIYLFFVPVAYVITAILIMRSKYGRYQEAIYILMEGKMKRKRSIKDLIIQHKVFVAVLTGAFLVIGVPIIIHAFFKAKAPCEWLDADWTSGDVLGYYGGLLSVSGAAVGIWATIRHEQKKYREDVTLQSLPFFILTTLRTDSKYFPISKPDIPEKIDLFPKNQYKEYPLDKVYYVIQNGTIKAKSKLTDQEKAFLERGGIVWERNGSMLSAVAKKYISLPFEIENAGNGAAAFTKIGFNLEGTEKKNYINAIPVKVGQKIYLHILCEDVQESDLGNYEFEVYYYDIFMNPYLQRYLVSIQNIGADVAISIETFSKQEKKDFPEKPLT